MSHNITKVDGLAWRKAQASVGQGACVELAPMPNGEIAIRNSNRQHLGAIPYTQPEMAAFIAGAKAGDFDDLLVV